MRQTLPRGDEIAPVLPDLNDVTRTGANRMRMTMSKKKVSKSSALLNAVTALSHKTYLRAVWLSSVVRDLSNRFTEFRDEVSSNFNAAAASIKNLEERTAVAFDRAESDITVLQIAARDNAKVINKHREEIDRAWQLAESRNSVYRKAIEDFTVVLQKFNERLSKIEGEPKATAAFMHLTGINGRLEVVEGKTGMLGECVVAHNTRLNGIERRENEPSLVDQYIMDSKLTGAYSLIASLEKRLRELESRRDEAKSASGNSSGLNNGANAPLTINKEAFLRP